MGRIRILEQTVADRIAAGEVVERPTSVVKELIENSLDADAQEVVVELEGVGAELIRVSDDGTGMDADDLHLAVQRFATSKIESAEDLFEISSFGFRGEALPSIAAIARIEITTALAGADSGRRLQLVAGVVTNDTAVGAPRGTIVEVRDLFFNTPARRKFLKSPGREFALIVDAVNRLALASPSVAFRVARDGQEIIRYPAGSIEDRLAVVLGGETAKRLVPCQLQTTHLGIAGWLGRPELARSNRTHQYAFVNRRAIHSRVVAGAVEQAYQQLLPSGQFPLFVIFAELPPQRVDVNVHPRKLEVRFDDDHLVFGSVAKAAKSALREAQLIRTIEPAAVSVVGLPTVLGLDRPLTTGLAFAPVEVRETSHLPAMRLLGQLHATYLLAQGDDGLIIIDQHAAHERILYERFLRSRQRGANNSQGLVAPITCELTVEEMPIFKANRSILEEIGFELEPFGDRTVLIRGIPQVAAHAAPDQLLHDLLAEAASGDNAPQGAQSLLERMTIATACRTAIKSGDKLTGEQMASLLHDLAETEDPFTCFHGRPTLVTVPQAHVERWFYRR